MKIEKNLGKGERRVRLLLGALGGAWLAARPEWDVSHWVMATLCLFLVLNALTSRCYLWHLLRLNSRGKRAGERATRGDAWDC
jgi:hypothetical protein